MARFLCRNAAAHTGALPRMKKPAGDREPVRCGDEVLEGDQPSQVLIYNSNRLRRDFELVKPTNPIPASITAEGSGTTPRQKLPVPFWSCADAIALQQNANAKIDQDNDGDDAGDYQQAANSGARRFLRCAVSARLHEAGFGIDQDRFAAFGASSPVVITLRDFVHGNTPVAFGCRPS
jgi:hypothetical protein